MADSPWFGLLLPAQGLIHTNGVSIREGEAPAEPMHVLTSCLSRSFLFPGYTTEKSISNDWNGASQIGSKPDGSQTEHHICGHVPQTYRDSAARIVSDKKRFVRQ